VAVASSAAASSVTSPRMAALTVAVAMSLAKLSPAARVAPASVAALHRLQRLPHLVRSFFRDPNLRYITA
jgi:hypothetical protein